jgi:hypothetical protein
MRVREVSGREKRRVAWSFDHESEADEEVVIEGG